MTLNRVEESRLFEGVELLRTLIVRIIQSPVQH